MSQAALAKKMKTRQPAIARLESGRGKPSLAVVERAAKALNAGVRVEMIPEELLAAGVRNPPWWEAITQGAATRVVGYEKTTVMMQLTTERLLLVEQLQTPAAVRDVVRELVPTSSKALPAGSAETIDESI